MIFAIVGGDARQRAVGERLQALGHEVVGQEQVCRADVVVLPLPLDADQVGLADILRAVRPGAVLLGGKVTPQAAQMARAAGVPLLDYLERPELEERNAIPTAEGCIGLLLRHRRSTLWQSHVLVLGFGRVAQALAVRLAALGARVTVAARRGEQRARAESLGCRAVPMQELGRAAAGVDTVVNTVPAPVLGRSVLRQLTPGALVIDLASRPGGTDFEAAQQLGVRAIHALGLPARCAPDTAGRFVAQAVLDILQERGGCCEQK